MGTVTYSGTDNLTATTYTAGEAWWRCADARIVEAYSFAACFEAIGVVRAHDRRRLPGSARFAACGDHRGIRRVVHSSLP
jgi:hypothetical protein